ncbi:MAG TPA: cytochrome c [Crocinitomicaceae bacterium]|nr:cytochrome c [Crocinitomicaceae bacterium]
MKIKILSLLTITTLFFASCGGEEKAKEVVNEVKEEVTENIEEAVEATGDMANIGIGPITSVELGDLDADLADEGKEIYKTNCTACHKFGKRYIGPALEGLLERRSPEWVMNMMLNPKEMITKDPIAMELLAEYSTQMADQQLSEDDARAILEFIRTKD